MRGFACIGLDNVKFADNVGGVMRAAGCYGADLIVVSGDRFKSLKRQPTDTQKTWKHIPVIEAVDLFDALPHDCVPVAVDLLPGAVSLAEYKHPERAFYIFGAEDQTLGARITGRCRDHVFVPTNFCMNLAATVNVVLYDRLAKPLLRDKLTLAERRIRHLEDVVRGYQRTRAEWAAAKAVAESELRALKEQRAA